MAIAHRTLPQLSEQDKQRFLDRVERHGPNDCWPWSGCKGKKGHGQFKKDRTMWGAHRIAYFLATNHDPVGMLIRHSCDNPPCCNPAHLLTGTDADNAADAVKRGKWPKGKTSPRHLHPESYAHLHGENHWMRKYPERIARGDRQGFRVHPEKAPKGERNGSAKITESDVIYIRELAGTTDLTRKEITAKFNEDREQHISVSAISRIVSRKNWKHID